MAKKRASSRTAPSPSVCGDLIAAAPALTDPRTQPDFDPAHFPLCDGGPAPAPGVVDPMARRQIEFLGAYYRLNRLYARLQASRAHASAEHAATVLREIQLAVIDRDALEDRYEPEGFLGEPVLDGIYYSNVEFTHVQSRQFYRPLTSSRFSCSLPIPPSGADVDGWVHRCQSSVFATLPDAAPGCASTVSLSPHLSTTDQSASARPRRSREASGASGNRPRSKS